MTENGRPRRAGGGGAAGMRVFRGGWGGISLGGGCEKDKYMVMPETDVVFPECRVSSAPDAA